MATTSPHNMDGKVVLITGATNGIGQVTARALAAQGATVVGVGRSAGRNAASERMIRERTGSDRVEYLLADLSSMQAVRDLAATFRARHDRLDVLINNAGAIFMSRRESADGLEMTFALNHMAPFLLTNLLLDRLTASAPARVITVSSAMHRTGRLDFDDLQHARSYSGTKAYADSKLMNALFTYELARRLAGTGVTANTLHPGFVRTGFFTNNWGIFGTLAIRAAGIAAISAERGAQTSIFLASSPDVDGISGEYFAQQHVTQSSPASHDTTAQHRLWTVSSQIAGLDDDQPAEIPPAPQLILLGNL